MKVPIVIIAEEFGQRYMISNQLLIKLNFQSLRKLGELLIQIDNCSS